MKSLSIFNFHLYGMSHLGIIYCFISWNVYFTQKCSTHVYAKFNYHTVSVENYIFINKCFSCKSYSVFNHLYILVTGRHNHQTRFAMINLLLMLPGCSTSKFGTKAFLYSVIASWNCFQDLLSEKNFRTMSLIIA